jgi:small Trp-rich protein
VDAAGRLHPRCGIGIDVTADMPLVWIGLLLVLLKWFEIGPIGELSWWWVLSPLAVAVLWFEWLERVFGFDKRQVEGIEWEQRRKERISAQFERKPGRR